jgi:hypothetical protein
MWSVTLVILPDAPAEVYSVQTIHFYNVAFTDLSIRRKQIWLSRTDLHLLSNTFALVIHFRARSSKSFVKNEYLSVSTLRIRGVGSSYPHSDTRIGFSESFQATVKIINVTRSSRKVSVVFFTTLINIGMYRQILEQIPHTKFHENPSGERRILRD